MKKLQLCICLALSVLLSNCKKDNEGNHNIFTSKSWKYGIVDKNVSTNPPGKILYNPVLNCQKDDVLTFKPDGQLIIFRGAIKCDIDESATDTLRYCYNKETKELLIDGETFNVVEESNNQIKYCAPLPSITDYNYIAFLLQ